MIRVARNQDAGRVAGGRIYRGHADPDWPLSSKFERWLHLRRGKDSSRSVRTIFGPSGPEAFEVGYLASFRDAATGIPGLDADNLSEDDLSILGRHHGLVTRLLDWTWSPYVAAFFAFAGLAAKCIPGFAEGLRDWIPTLPDGYVVVWALAPVEDVIFKGEFDLVTERKSNFYRQRAQLGIFTRLRHDQFLDVASYLENRGIGHYLERIEIGAGEVGKALNDLRLMNISFGPLFPDLDGAAKEANLRSEISGIGWSGKMVKLES